MVRASSQARGEMYCKVYHLKMRSKLRLEVSDAMQSEVMFAKACPNAPINYAETFTLQFLPFLISREFAFRIYCQRNLKTRQT